MKKIKFRKDVISMAEKNTLKDLLAKYSIMKNFKAGDQLFKYGERAEKIYFILSGLIRIYIKNQEKEIEVQRSKNGSFVGKSAFTAADYSSRAEVYIETKALEFQVSDLRKIMQQHSEFAEKMINNLTQYIETLENINNLELPPISEIDKKIETESHIKKAIAAEKKAAAEIKTPADFYLKGHRSYHKRAKKGDEYYLYEKEIECPVCSHKMKIKKIRNSRLRIEDIREDLRPLYKNFKLYNYSILSCSNCFFTARRKDFYDFSKKRKKKINNSFKSLVKAELGKNFKIEYDEPRNINQVLDAHYLALKLYNYTDFYTDKKAFLWRELSWIYEDLNENKLSEKASLNALADLEKFYFRDDTKSSKKESNNISLLLAVLYYKHQQIQKALPLLDDLIRDNRISLRQRNKAKDLFLKIRAENRN